MTRRLTTAGVRGSERRAAWIVAGAALSVLAGCGASSLASFAGFHIARRDQLSSWTPVLERTAQASPNGVAPPIAAAPAPSAAVTTATAVAAAPVAAKTSALSIPGNAVPTSMAPLRRPSTPWATTESSTGTPSSVASSMGRVGRFALLTYNVAGLPQMFSPSTPRINIPLVSPLLNRYDVALVQEDFSYHRELVQKADHPYRSTPMRPHSFVGEGLSQFSRFAFDAVVRVRWDRCNGYVSSSTDCLADKGFSFSELHLAPGVVVHLYNLHADAGSGSADIQTRALEFGQLAAYIRQRSRGYAVIVAGDTNLRTHQGGDAEILDRFLEAASLRDACRSLACPEEEPIDRVMFRSSAELALSSLGWWKDRRFVDARGNPLSDHAAIGIEVGWQLVRELGEPAL